MPGTPLPTHRKPKTRVIRILVGVAVGLVILGLVLPFLESPPRFAAADVTAVQVSLPGHPGPSVVSTDPAAIAALVEALNTSRHRFGIKRESVARITLYRPAGDVEMDVVPGSGARVSIWMRCGAPENFWEVDREQLVQAMAALGLTGLLPEP
jgi:hypothetical protein